MADDCESAPWCDDRLPIEECAVEIDTFDLSHMLPIVIIVEIYVVGIDTDGE